MKQRIWIIGASSGIGLELVKKWLLKDHFNEVEGINTVYVKWDLSLLLKMKRMKTFLMVSAV